MQSPLVTSYLLIRIRQIFNLNSNIENLNLNNKASQTNRIIALLLIPREEQPKQKQKLNE